VRIASSHVPNLPGTRLMPAAGGAGPAVTALTLVRRAALVRASAREMGDEGIVPGAVLEAFRRYKIDLVAGAIGFNGGRFLWLIEGESIDRFVDVLRQHGSPGFQVEVQRSVAVLGIVGESVASLPGLMGRVDRCLAEAGATALTVLQGASPNSVVLALADDERRLSAVLRSLRRELGLDPKHQGGRL
jgi:aspartokinase